MSVSTFKRGRRPALHTRRTMQSALALHRALAPLGKPPTVSSDYVSAVTAAGGWGGVMGNDQVGDCTIADCGHQVVLHTANVGPAVVPTTAQCLAVYSAISGYTPADEASDTGCDETTVCGYMVSTGLAGQKSAGSGMVDPANLDHLRWSTQIFGACRLGIVVDQAMEEAFSAGQPWEKAAASNDPNAGGHDVPIVKYDAEWAYVVTWGRLQAVAWALVAQSDFLQEGHCEAWPDFVRSGGTAPSGFDLSQLLAELPQIVSA